MTGGHCRARFNEVTTDGHISSDCKAYVHYDHTGSLHEFEDRRIHGSEQAKMADYQETQWLRRDEFPEPVIEMLAELGYPLEGELLIDALPSADFDVANYRVQSATTTSLGEGDVIDLGDRHFEVLHLPGHTPGSLGLWERESATLFSGDAIYDGPLLDTLPESDLVAYATTMKRLRDLAVRVVHAGHEPSFGRERLVELVDEYLASRA